MQCITQQSRFDSCSQNMLDSSGHQLMCKVQWSDMLNSTYYCSSRHQSSKLSRCWQNCKPYKASDSSSITWLSYSTV